MWLLSVDENGARGGTLALLTEGCLPREFAYKSVVGAELGPHSPLVYLHQLLVRASQIGLLFYSRTISTRAATRPTSWLWLAWAVFLWCCWRDWVSPASSLSENLSGSCAWRLWRAACATTWYPATFPKLNRTIYCRRSIFSHPIIEQNNQLRLVVSSGPTCIRCRFSMYYYNYENMQWTLWIELQGTRKNCSN